LESLIDEDISKFQLLKSSTKYKSNIYYSKIKFLPKTSILKDSGVVKISIMFHGVSMEKLIFCFAPTFNTKKLDPTIINIHNLKEFSSEELREKYPKEDIGEMPTYLQSFESYLGQFLDNRINRLIFHMDYNEETKSYYQYNKSIIDEEYEIDGKIDLFSKRKMKFTRENGEKFTQDSYFAYIFSVLKIKEIDKNTSIMNFVFSKFLNNGSVLW
jgi:hypothetical protein